MGGINSLSGLNTVSVDFRPTIDTDSQKTGNVNLPQQGQAILPGDEQQPVKANARSVVQKLDVLLLNAASNSVAADGVKRMDTMGKALVKLGVIAQKDADKLVNLATQDTAKAFGCEDVVVKYSVGNHNGQFGFFMEKAKGVSGAGFAQKIDADGGGVPPSEMHKITDPAEQTRIKGSLAQKLNRLMWLDLITGQGDRHWSNYFVHIDPTTHEPTVNAIDNDASFSANRIGLMKFKLDKAQTARYEAELKNVCQKVHGRGWKAEYDNRVSKDRAIVRDGDTMTIDLTRAQSHEAKMAIIHTLGLQSVALPEEIDEDFYNHLIAMGDDPAKKKAFLDSIAPRISPDALNATEARLDEAIDHAKALKEKGKVYGKEQWQNEDNLKDMTGSKASVTITKTDGSKVKVDNKIECVRDYNQRKCPSFFKREFFHKMFDKPE